MRTRDNTMELNSSVGPHGKSYLRAWVDESGLVLGGQDLSPVVEAFWGDSDYEYWLTVDRAHLGEVLTSLGGKLGLPPEKIGDQTSRDSRVLELVKPAWLEGALSTDVLAVRD